MLEAARRRGWARDSREARRLMHAYEQSLTHFSEALKGWRQLKELEGRARTLNAVASVRRALQEEGDTMLGQ